MRISRTVRKFAMITLIMALFMAGIGSPIFASQAPNVDGYSLEPGTSPIIPVPLAGKQMAQLPADQRPTPPPVVSDANVQQPPAAAPAPMPSVPTEQAKDVKTAEAQANAPVADTTGVNNSGNDPITEAVELERSKMAKTEAARSTLTAAKPEEGLTPVQLNRWKLENKFELSKLDEADEASRGNIQRLEAIRKERQDAQQVAEEAKETVRNFKAQLAAAEAQNKVAETNLTTVKSEAQHALADVTAGKQVHYKGELLPVTIVKATASKKQPKKVAQAPAMTEVAEAPQIEQASTPAPTASPIAKRHHKGKKARVISTPETAATPDIRADEKPVETAPQQQPEFPNAKTRTTRRKHKGHKTAIYSEVPRSGKAQSHRVTKMRKQKLADMVENDRGDEITSAEFQNVAPEGVAIAIDGKTSEESAARQEIFKQKIAAMREARAKADAARAAKFGKYSVMETKKQTHASVSVPRAATPVHNAGRTTMEVIKNGDTFTRMFHFRFPKEGEEVASSDKDKEGPVSE